MAINKIIKYEALKKCLWQATHLQKEIIELQWGEFVSGFTPSLRLIGNQILINSNFLFNYFYGKNLNRHWRIR